MKIQKESSEKLGFSRENELSSTPDQLTRRELFSICGNLVGHHRVDRWLKVACGFIKREAKGSSWDHDVGEMIAAHLRQVLKRFKGEDPVMGVWGVERTEHGTVRMQYCGGK